MPVPVVFSPAAGYNHVSRWKHRGGSTHNLVGRLVDAAGELLILHCGVGTLLHHLR